MKTNANGPGAALVILHRMAARTDVLIRNSGEGKAPLHWAAPEGDGSQRSVLEDLLRDHGAGVDRVYASPISVPGEQGLLGVFVGFAEDAVAAPPGSEWVDLRDACRSLPPIWSAALATVRERFVAKSPDEALRVL